MKRSIVCTSILALALSATVFAAMARQAAPLLPPLPVDADGQLQVGRSESVPAEFAVAFAAAAQSTNTDPALLFALAARSKFAANRYGADLFEVGTNIRILEGLQQRGV